MNDFRKFIEINKRNNLRLFFQISIIALVGIVGFFLWQPSVQMQDSNQDNNYEQNKRKSPRFYSRSRQSQIKRTQNNNPTPADFEGTDKAEDFPIANIFTN